MVTVDIRKNTSAPQLAVLLQAGNSGDSAAYHEFLNSVSIYLRRFISRRVPAADIEDVLQEILISIHKARHTYDGKRSVLPWISSIARFRLADHLRKYYADMRQMQVDISPLQETLTANVTESGVIDEYVSEEVGKLPERQRRILYLMHTEGYTAKEVGMQLGMTESAVKVAAHRAYKVIKTGLSA